MRDMDKTDQLMKRQLYAAFLSVDGVGRRSFQKLLTVCDHLKISLEDVWVSPDKLCSDYFRLNETQINNIINFQKKYSISEYFDYLKEKNIEVILEGDDQYPSLLREIDDRPLLLFVQGDLGFVNQLPIAVVGTRRITSYGQMAVTKLVEELVAGGATIISGGMYGVDAQAHWTCLKNYGRTAAILGFGFNHTYPKYFQRLADQIIANGGALISEFAPHIPPQKGNFPVRNRIVAGMSLGTVVIEAALKSGSLITAQLAAEYNREVFAVPGPITNRFSQGTKNLINQGAKLITSGTEILTEIYPTLAIGGFHFEKKIPKIDKIAYNNDLERCLYKIIQEQPVTTDQICHRLQQNNVSEITVALSMMELANIIVKNGESWYIC